MQVLSFTSPETSAEATFTQRFLTKGVQSESPFTVQRPLLAETLAPSATQDVAETCEAEVSRWAFGDLVFTRTLYANTPAHQWHHLGSLPDHWCVTLAHSRSGGQGARSSAPPRQGNRGFGSLAIPLEGQAEDTEVLTLFLPGDFCRDEADEPERVQDLDIDPELGGLLAGYMETLARQLPHISPDHSHALAVATRALVTACIAPRGERSEAADPPLTSLLIDRARIVVRQNMASPEFGPEQLARLMAMSRSKLYRFFESTGGVAHFINRERLREAHRRLVSPRDALSIHVIGNEVGFIDHSTFSRSFRREFGYSPTEARERSLARLSAQPLGLALHDAAAEVAPGAAAADSGQR